MDVHYSDNHILLFIKPEGMPTQSSTAQEISAESMAKQWVKKTYAKQGNVFLEPIHRLDKPVSGLVLFARTSKSLSRLQAMMRERKIKKTYHALVEGVPKENQALLSHYLVHEEYRALVSTKDCGEAKLALLEYKLISTDESLSVLEISLLTGRYHQIRAQLSAIGHPVVGDVKYGSTRPHPTTGIALKSSKLEFIHPVSNELMTFSL